MHIPSNLRFSTGLNIFIEGDFMTKWLEKIKMQKGLRNLILLALFVLMFILPEQYVLTDIAYLLILFFIAYISTYIETTPIWKGVFFSFLLFFFQIDGTNNPLSLQ